MTPVLSEWNGTLSHHARFHLPGINVIMKIAQDAPPIGAGTDVAMESADIVLMKSDPFDVVGAIELSHATLRKMHQNLWWAVGYNVIAFPLAAGVLYPVLLGPSIAALAMSGSSALVAINALMLKRTKLTGIRRQHTTAPPIALTPKMAAL
jgi:Cu2+-exporting ATPase